MKEEGEYEYAAYHPGQGSQQEAKMESGVLYQPLEALGGEAQRLDSSAVQGEQRRTGLTPVYDPVPLRRRLFRRSHRRG
jgi:hypothetical protein